MTVVDAFAKRLGWTMAIALVLAGTMPVAAQWLKHPDPRTPRTLDGKPNLTAPTPRTPDGKPDLGGILECR